MAVTVKHAVLTLCHDSLNPLSKLLTKNSEWWFCGSNEIEAGMMSGQLESGSVKWIEKME